MGAVALFLCPLNSSIRGREAQICAAAVTLSAHVHYDNEHAADTCGSLFRSETRQWRGGQRRLIRAR